MKSFYNKIILKARIIMLMFFAVFGILLIAIYD